jgi:hypothetical protein
MVLKKVMNVNMPEIRRWSINSGGTAAGISRCQTGQTNRSSNPPERENLQVKPALLIRA